MQRIIRRYKDETGESEVDMKEVVKFAIERNLWKLPPPTSPFDKLAKDFTQAAREEYRKDAKTGQEYRVNHAIPVRHGLTQLHLWIDIDEAPRHRILISLMNRREQMVGDGLQLTIDAEHWNNIHPKEDPIEIPLDLTDDVEWKKNTPKAS